MKSKAPRRCFAQKRITQDRWGRKQCTHKPTEMQFKIDDKYTESILGSDECDTSLIETTWRRTVAAVTLSMPAPNQRNPVSITPMSMNNNDLIVTSLYKHPKLSTASVN